MKKISIILYFLCLLCEPTHAQSLKDLFLQMPQEVCPSLSEYNRLELVDNQKNGKPMQTRNQFRTLTQMKELTDDYAHLSLSKQSEKELLLLPKNDGTRIIMVVSTVLCDTVPDASISFYSVDWKPLDATDYMSEPVSDSFRQITINRDGPQLTIKTNAPLTLHIDGANPPVETPPTLQKYVWKTEQNKFVVL